MARNIVLLLDGTSNEVSSNRSNVLRLYGTLDKGPGQLVYYDPGVGTFGGDFAWSRWYRKALEVWGLATGWGFDVNVLEAYRFLVENYRGARTGDEPDRIYIFGFSRGAYAARVLAGFINALGLIEPRNLNLLTYAYRAYKRINDAPRSGGTPETKEDREASFQEIRLYERMLDPERPPIRFLGLFDTVASVIESGRYGPRLRSHAFTSRNPSVESVRHAVAIHERRTMFMPTLWPGGEPYCAGPFKHSDAPMQDAREVWFTGCHSDVGGGFAEAESGLAKLPLYWMIEEARPTGLAFRDKTVERLVLGRDEERRYAAPDCRSARHNSMAWYWKILEVIPRRASPLSRRPNVMGWTIPMAAHRAIPEGARIHRSVIERAEALGDRPPNLPASYEVEEGPSIPG